MQLVDAAAEPHVRSAPRGPSSTSWCPCSTRRRSSPQHPAAPPLPVDAVPVLVADHHRRQRLDRRHLGPRAARCAGELPHVARRSPRPQGPRPRAAHAWIASDADGRRLHGRRPLDRPRRARSRWSRPWSPATPTSRSGRRLAPGVVGRARARSASSISRTYNLILRTVLATRVRDAQCGFKAVRADVARRLLPAIEDDGWFFDTELLLARRAQRPAHPRGAGRLDRRPRQPRARRSHRARRPPRHRAHGPHRSRPAAASSSSAPRRGGRSTTTSVAGS